MLELLSINTMFREELGCSYTDFVFFQALHLPGDLLIADPSIANHFSEDLIRQMQHFATSLRLAPTRVKQSNTLYMPRKLKICTHIFVKQNPIKPNLTPVYSGLFLVIFRTDKTFCILSNDRFISVAVNKVKPCFRLQNSAQISHAFTVFDHSSDGNLPRKNFDRVSSHYHFMPLMFQKINTSALIYQ